jgi:hypothetical protein
MSAVWVETTSGALVRGDTVVWISRAATSLTIQQRGGDSLSTVADWGAGHPDLPKGFGTQLAALLSSLAGQRDPHLVRAAVGGTGWSWEVERIEAPAQAPAPAEGPDR